MSIKERKNDVTVVIVNYNTNSLLHNCIESVFQHTAGVKIEIIVIDNNSADKSFESVSTKFPNVKIVKLPSNVGFGAANNVAATYTDTEYIFLLNSDTLLRNNAIKFFYDFMETENTDKKIGAIGSYLLNECGEIIHSYGSFPTLKESVKIILKNRFERTVQTLKRAMRHKPIRLIKSNDFLPVDYVTGANMFMRTDIFKKCGMFDVNYFMYFEETDLQLIMSKKGLVRGVIPEPKIIHLEGSSFGKSVKKSNNRRIYYDKSLIYYFSKNSNKFNTFVIRFFLFATSLDFKFTCKENLIYIKSILKMIHREESPFYYAK